MNTESLIKPPESKALKGGRVILLPGEEIGEHKTDKREELIIVLKGTATLTKGKEPEETIVLKAGETHYIKEDVFHNVKNTSDEELKYVYVVSLFD